MNYTTRSEWMWRVLHVLSVFIVPFVLTALMGCIKAKEEKADLGPEVPADEIDHALSKAVNGASLANTAIGQYVTFSVNRRLEQEETTINMGYTKVNVFDKTEDPNKPTKNIFHLKIEKATRLPDNTFEIKGSEEPLEVDKPAPLIASSFSEMTVENYVKGAQEISKKPGKITYHRLRESSGTVEPPATVKSRPGCGGLSPCEIPIRYVSFDAVQWFTDDSYQKITVELGFSTKTPYLPFGESFDQLNGLLIQDCRATMVPIEGRDVYVRDCLNLEDFQK